MNLDRPAMSVLLASFGIALIFAMARGESVHRPFERLVIGFLAITFYASALSTLFSLGSELESYLVRMGRDVDLQAFVAKVLYQAGTKYDTSTVYGSTANFLTYFSQVFRTGVWGIISSVTELLFVLARFLLEVGRDALWQVLLVLFPMGAAVFPFAPKILLGMVLLALELVLWLPILAILNVATSEVARRYSTVSHDLGFYVLALEIISVCLTLLVPVIAHKLVSGSLSGNILAPWKSTALTAMNLLSIPRIPVSLGTIMRSGKSLMRRKIVLLLLATGALFSTPVQAAEKIVLTKGFLKKVPCEGRLYVSAVGNDRVVYLEALPKELGCAVILKPLTRGKTNLILETSSGSVETQIQVRETGK